MLQSPFTRKGNFPSSRPLPRKEGKKTYVKEKKLMTYWISDIYTNQASPILCQDSSWTYLSTTCFPHEFTYILYTSMYTNNFLKFVTKEIKGFEVPTQTYIPSQPAGRGAQDCLTLRLGNKDHN